MATIYPFVQDGTFPFPFLGSVAARSESAAMMGVGLRALRALHPHAALQYQEGQPKSSIRDHDIFPLPSSSALYEEFPGANSAVHAFRVSAEVGVDGPQSTPAIQTALELGMRYEEEDHHLFMQALFPKRMLQASIVENDYVRSRMLANIQSAIAGPNGADFRQAANLAMKDVVGRGSPWYKRRSTNIRPAKTPLNKRRQADSAWQLHTNTWRRDMSVLTLLQPTTYTDSDAPSIQSMIESIFSMPKLGDILDQRYADGCVGRPVTICGLDGEFYTRAQLAKHEQYESLAHGDGLFKLLRSPEMRQLVTQSSGAKPLVGFSQAQINRLAMAQRIASVVIHYVVRDSIKYELGGWRRKASDTLRLHQGSCSASANLAVALGRAAGIPCGVMRMHVELPGYFGIAIAPNTLVAMERASVHFHVGWVTLQANSSQGLEWRLVQSDPSDNYELTAGVAFNFPHTRLVSFNGVNDSLLNFPHAYVYDCIGPLFDIDPLLEKKPVRAVTGSDRQRLLRVVGSAESPETVELQLRSLVSFIEHRIVMPVIKTAEACAQDVTGYNIVLTRLMDAPDIQNILPAKAVLHLQSFLTERKHVRRLIAESVDNKTQNGHAKDWAKSFLLSAEEAGMPRTYLTSVDKLAPVLEDIIRKLCSFFVNMQEDSRLCFARGLAASHRARRFASLGTDSLARKASLTHLYRTTYTFMTNCYPSRQENSFDPAKPLWLPQADQRRYLSFLRGSAAPTCFDDSLENAVAFVVGPRAAQFHGDGKAWRGSVDRICAMASIAVAEVDRFVNFHEHLLSSPEIVVMNCSVRFHSEVSGQIRCGPDVHMEFEAWLAALYPTLAAVHRAELANHTEYRHTVYVYLLGRMIPQRPSEVREALTSFIAHMQRPEVVIPRLEAHIDEQLREFIGTDGPIESFLSERQGGLMKPYGVLYTLWKACVLPATESRMLLQRLIKLAHTSRPHLSKL